jgi:hypothetical protein
MPHGSPCGISTGPAFSEPGDGCPACFDLSDGGQRRRVDRVHRLGNRMCRTRLGSAQSLEFARVGNTAHEGRGTVDAMVEHFGAGGGVDVEVRVFYKDLRDIGCMGTGGEGGKQRDGSGDSDRVPVFMPPPSPH